MKRPFTTGERLAWLGRRASVLLLLALGLASHALPALAQAPAWSVNPSDYESTMNVTGALYFGADRSTSTDDVVAAFVGSEVRGVAQPLLVGGEPVFFMTIYANQDGEPLTFKAYNEAAGEVREVTESLDFAANAVVGTPASPYEWTTEEAANPPPAPTPVAPADGAQAQPTSLTLRWQAVADATGYDVQVASDAAFQTLLVNAAGWVPVDYALSGLAAGATYHWRVRANMAGGASAWSGISAFSTASSAPPQAPAVPTPSTPLDGSTNVPRDLELTWQGVDGADRYNVQVATTADFSNLVVGAEDVMGTALALQDLASSTTYHWRLRSVNAGGASAWSASFAFTTEAATEAPPAVPLLVTPRDNALGMSTDLTLFWQEVAAATYYLVQVATMSTFNVLAVEKQVSNEASVAVGGLTHGTTYFWRVRAVGPGGASPWSSLFQFVTAPPPNAPAVPTPLSPADGTAEQPIALTLHWLASATADMYVVQVAVDAAFLTLAATLQVQDQAWVLVQGLAEGRTHFWRVRAENAAGASAWSDEFAFTTAVQPAPPAAPRLLLPADGTPDHPTELILTWQADPWATQYRVQVAETSSFDTPTIDTAGRSETALVLEALSAGVTYHWRVQGEGPGGTGPWSEVFSFTTAVPPPAAPTLMAPANGATMTNTTLLFQWQEADHATHFQLQIARVPDFTDELIEQDLAGNEILVARLLPGMEYHWRVRGVGAGGTGPWSEVFQFTTPTATAADPADQPAALTVAPNYPNPFRNETTVAYTLPHSERVQLTVYDLLGKEVTRLVDARQGAGRHEATFEARGLPSGLYVYRFRAGTFESTRTMMLIQ